MPKVNLLYRRPANGALVVPWVTSDGIINSLKKQDLLNYEYDCLGRGEFINYNELRKYPTLVVRGYDFRFHTAVDNLWGNTFLASIETETTSLRPGMEDKISIGGWDSWARDYARKFDVVFVASKRDQQDYYGKNPNDVFLYRFFVDTDVVRNVCESEYDELCYIGTDKHREDFLNSAPFIKRMVSPAVTNLLDTAELYVQNICKHRFLVAPPGKTIRIMSARPYEIMACERVCFCYVDDIIKSEDDLSPLEDGKNIVFFETIDELKRKYEYYKKHPDLCDYIGKNARRTALEHYSCDKWTKWMTEKMYERLPCKV